MQALPPPLIHQVAVLLGGSSWMSGRTKHLRNHNDVWWLKLKFGTASECKPCGLKYEFSLMYIVLLIGSYRMWLAEYFTYHSHLFRLCRHPPN